MYAHCIRSWRPLGHSRRSPLSSLRGFAPEPLKVLFVCTRTAAVRSAGTAVEGTRWSLGTLGFLQRSLVVALRFVPGRRIYWRYVVESRGCCHVFCVWVKPSLVPTPPPRWASSRQVLLCHIHKLHARPCHGATLTDIVAPTPDTGCVGLFERPEECESNERRHLKHGSMSQS